jgi:D-3-phosphoglycerate dehydrogenase
MFKSLNHEAKNKSEYGAKHISSKVNMKQNKKPITTLVMERFNLKEAKKLAGQRIHWLSPKQVDQFSQVQALLIRTRTRLSEIFLNQFPQLKLIVSMTSGFDHLPLRTIKERGLTCFYCPESHAQSVAELTLAMMLISRRRLKESYSAIQNGFWREASQRGQLLSGARVGLVGLGRIGRRVFLLAQAFGAQVFYFDPFVSLCQKDQQQFGESLRSLDELACTSDLISLHLPLTPKTKHLVNAAFLQKCRDGSVLINTSRGGLVDENALKMALESKEPKNPKKGLALAVLDVFAEEPLPKDSWLRQHNRVMASAHIGAFTIEAETASSLEATQIVLRFFAQLEFAQLEHKQLEHKQLEFEQHQSEQFQLEQPKGKRLDESKGRRLEHEPKIPWYGNLPLNEPWYLAALGDQHQNLLGF